MLTKFLAEYVERCSPSWKPSTVKATLSYLNSAILPAPADGCRPGEILCLRWCEVKAARFALTDSKTGPRHILLGEAARELLDCLAETVSGERCFRATRETAQ